MALSNQYRNWMLVNLKVILTKNKIILVLFICIVYRRELNQWCKYSISYHYMKMMNSILMTWAECKSPHATVIDCRNIYTHITQQTQCQFQSNLPQNKNIREWRNVAPAQLSHALSCQSSACLSFNRFHLDLFWLAYWLYLCTFIAVSFIKG